jgi:hypothetical protein
MFTLDVMSDFRKTISNEFRCNFGLIHSATTPPTSKSDHTFSLSPIDNVGAEGFSTLMYYLPGVYYLYVISLCWKGYSVPKDALLQLQ